MKAALPMAPIAVVPLFFIACLAYFFFILIIISKLFPPRAHFFEACVSQQSYYPIILNNFCCLDCCGRMQLIGANPSPFGYFVISILRFDASSHLLYFQIFLSIITIGINFVYNTTKDRYLSSKV